LYLEIYPDIVFLINFPIDFFLIFLVKKVGKKSSSLPRLVLSAAAGGMCAVVYSLFPWMNIFFKLVLIYGASSFIMILIAFGRLKLSDMLKQLVVLNFITYLLGGIMNSIYYHTNFRLYLLSIGRFIGGKIPVPYFAVLACASAAAVTLVIWFLRMYLVRRPLIYDVDLFFEGRRIRAKGLMDTGNCLYDPVRGKPVMVVESKLADELLTPKARKDMEDTMKYLEGKSDDIRLSFDNGPGFRFCFIPYRSVGKSGMLMGVKLDKILIHTGDECICNEGVTAAICESGLTGRCKDYQVILHRELL